MVDLSVFFVSNTILSDNEFLKSLFYDSFREIESTQNMMILHRLVQFVKSYWVVSCGMWMF